MREVCLLLCVLVLIAGCAGESSKEAKSEGISGEAGGGLMKKVNFETEDSITIAGNYWKGSNKGVLLLHMMPATKESWDGFAERLNAKGYSVLAIDLRGHGGSNEGGKLDYRKFSDAEHQSSKHDVEAGAEFLRQDGVAELYVAGASIGANLALEYQAKHPEVKKSILLSPGIDYRGIQTIPLAKQLQAGQEVFLAGGKGDGNSADMVSEISNHIEGGKIVRTPDSNAHGTNLFGNFPELMEDMVGWLG